MVYATGGFIRGVEGVAGMKLKYPEVSGRRRRRGGRAETTGEGVKVAGFRGGRARRPALHPKLRIISIPRQDLVVGLDGYGQGLALLERFFGYLKANNDGSFRAVPASSLASGESAGSELSFKAGMPVISDRVNGRRAYPRRLVGRGSELRLRCES